MKRLIATLLVSAGLLLPAGAEQLNVRNQPFKGSVVRESGKIWVDFKSFAEALDVKYRGDEQSGFLVGDAQAELPGSGKVNIQGTEVECKVEETVLVELNQVSKLLGARVVINKQLDSIDVTMVKARANMPASSNSIEQAAYTLIEFSSPGNQLCKDIQPAIIQAKSEFKGVQHILCNVDNQGSLRQYLKYKQTKDGSYPEVTLIDRQGNVQFQLRGNHVISGGLVKEMRKKVKAN